MKRHIEMCRPDRIDEVVKATQKLIIEGLRDIVAFSKTQEPDEGGLSWAAIYFILDQFEKKEFCIISQSEEM